MEREDAARITAELVLLARAEVAVAELYRACATAWPRDADFWCGLEREEYRHAAAFEMMRARVAAAPEAFRPGRGHRPGAVQAFTQGVRQWTGLVRGGRMTPARALALARDLERSIVEQRGHDVAETSDVAYARHLARIFDDTVGHLRCLEERIAACAGEAAA